MGARWGPPQRRSLLYSGLFKAVMPRLDPGIHIQWTRASAQTRGSCRNVGGQRRSRTGRVAGRGMICSNPKACFRTEAFVGIITNDMRRVVEEQQLGFVATVGLEGTPNLSPKGTTAIWDDDHLVFADI